MMLFIVGNSVTGNSFPEVEMPQKAQEGWGLSGKGEI
jgi:hypothetical protein